MCRALETLRSDAGYAIDRGLGSGDVIHSSEGTSFVGRELELGQLNEAWGRAQDRLCRVVEGPAEIGKTALVGRRGRRRVARTGCPSRVRQA
ncbi:MAG: hypothetical protein ACRD2C_26760 [Acidimicrobiales bacterium]